MTQRILIEILLFLIPFGLFLVYRLGSREVSVKDRWPLTMLTSIGAAIAIVGLLAWPLFEGSDKGLCTEFARYQNGVTTAPKKIECAPGGAPTGTPLAPETLAPEPEPERMPVTPPSLEPSPGTPMTPPNGGLNPG